MFRLSPAEVNELCFQENLKQRKLRLLQVREQAKTFSADTREKYRKEKRKQINALKRRVTKESEQEKENDLKILESVYESQLEKFGESHKAAQNQPDIEQLKEKKEKHQEAVAISRGKEALSALRKETALKNAEAKKHLEARQQALEVEKQRAAWISRLDLPTLDQVDQVLLNTDPITATQDTPNNGQQKLPHVEKEKWDAQRDARVAAMEENMNIERNAEMRQEVDEENAKKAKARFNAAFEDEMCDKGYAKLIEHLDLTEKQEWAKNKQDYGKVKKPPVIEDSKQKEFQNKEEELECIVEKIFNGMEEYRGRNVQKLHVGGHSNEEERLDDDSSQASPKQEDFSANRASKSSNGGLTQLLTRIRQQREDLARQHMDFLDKQHWPRIDHKETRPFKVSSPFLDKIDTDQVSETEYINIPDFDVTKTLKTEQPFVKAKKDDKLIVDPTHLTVNSNDLVEETQPTKFKTKVLHFPPVDIESNKQTTKTEAPALQDQTVTVKRKVKSFKKHDIPVPVVSVETTTASVEFPENIGPTFQSVGEKPEEGQQKMNYYNKPPIQTTTTTSRESGLQVKSSDEILLTQKMNHKKTKIFSGKTESPVGSETSYMSLPEGYGMSDFNPKNIPDNIFEQKVHSKEQLPTSEERISIIKSKSDSSEKKVVFGSLQDTSDSNRLSESHEKIQTDSGKPFIYKERLFPALGDPDSILNLKKEYIRKLASKYFSIPTDFRDGTGDPQDSEDHEKETPTHHRFPSPQRTDSTSFNSISSTNTAKYNTSPTAYIDRKLEEKGNVDTIPETVNTYFCTSDSNEYTATVVSKEDNKQMSKVKHLNIERVNTLSVSQETGYSSLFDITTSTACELSDKSISPLISESKPSAVGKMQKMESQQKIELLSTDFSVPDDQTETTDSVVVTSAPTLPKDIEIYSQTNHEGSESNEIGILECLDALARSSLLDATYQRQRPPPTISRVPLGENLVLHELSTILEVDTPSSSYIKLSPEKYSSVFSFGSQDSSSISTFETGLLDSTFLDPEKIEGKSKSADLFTTKESQSEFGYSEGLDDLKLTISSDNLPRGHKMDSCSPSAHTLGESEEHLNSFVSSPSQYPLTSSKSFSTSKYGESSRFFAPLTPQVCNTSNTSCSGISVRFPQQEGQKEKLVYNQAEFPVTTSITWAESFSNNRGGESSVVFRPLTPRVFVTSDTSCTLTTHTPSEREEHLSSFVSSPSQYPLTSSKSFSSSKGGENSIAFRTLTPQTCNTSDTSHSSIKMRSPQQEVQKEKLVDNQVKYPVTTTITWAESISSSRDGESSTVFRPLTPQLCVTSDTSHSSIKIRPPQQLGQTERLVYNEAKYPVTTAKTWAELLQQATSRRTVSSPVDSISSIGSSEWIKKDMSIAEKIVSQSTPVKYLSELDQEKGIIEEPDLTLLGSELSSITCGRQDDLHRTLTSEKDFDITQDSLTEDHFTLLQVTSAPCDSHSERSSVPLKVLQMKSVPNTSPYSVIKREVEVSSPLLTEGSLTESLLSFQKHEQSCLQYN